MSIDPNLLIVTEEKVPADWVRRLEARGLFVEIASLEALRSAFQVVGPDLVVHVGQDGAKATVDFLIEESSRRLVRAVVVTAPEALAVARRLDKRIVVSVLAADTPLEVLVDRIVKLAVHAVGGARLPEPVLGSAKSSRPVPRLASKPPSIRAGSMLRALEEVPQSPSRSRAGRQPSSVPPRPLDGVVRSNRVQSSPPPSLLPALGGLPETPKQPIVSEPFGESSPLRIAVVDDDLMRADAVAQALREEGHRVILTPSDPRRTRWAILRSFGPLVVLRDSASSSDLWIELFRADTHLRRAELVAAPFGWLFNESSGAVSLEVVAEKLRRIRPRPPSAPPESVVPPPVPSRELGPSEGASLRRSSAPPQFKSSLPGVPRSVAPSEKASSSLAGTAAPTDGNTPLFGRLPFALPAPPPLPKEYAVQRQFDAPLWPRGPGAAPRETSVVGREVGPAVFPFVRVEPSSPARLRRGDRSVELVAADEGGALDSEVSSLRGGELAVSKSSRTRWPFVSVGVALLLAATSFVLVRRGAPPSAAPEISTEFARGTTVESGAAAIEPGAVAVEPRGRSPEPSHLTSAPRAFESVWVQPARPEVPSCDDVVPDRGHLRLGDLDQNRLLWKRARGLLVQGKMDEALVSLCEAVFVSPQSLALEALAEHFLSLGAPALAHPWAEAAVRTFPRRPKALDLRGDVENQLGDLEASKASWVQALRVGERDQKVLDQIGRQLFVQGQNARRRGDTRRAERLYRRAATLSPSNAEALSALGQIELERRAPERAALWLELATAADRTRPSVGRLREALGDLAE